MTGTTKASPENPADLQFSDETLDGPLGECLRLAALPVAHQTVHDAQTGVGGGERLPRRRRTQQHRGHLPTTDVPMVSGQAPGPARQGVRNSCPARQGVRHSCPARQGVRHSCPVWQGVRNSCPARQGVRHMLPGPAGSEE